MILGFCICGTGQTPRSWLIPLARYRGACPASRRWETRQCRSVQSIMSKFELALATNIQRFISARQGPRQELVGGHFVIRDSSRLSATVFPHTSRTCDIVFNLPHDQVHCKVFGWSSIASSAIRCPICALTLDAAWEARRFSIPTRT